MGLPSGSTPTPMSLRSELATARRAHWPCYLAEAGGLAFFMICASLLRVALKHPASPVHQALVAQGVGPAPRRVPMGVGVGLVVVFLTYLPWTKQSGAHINPAITLAFWHLGRIRRADALWYGLAQAAGSLAAVLLLKALLGAWYAHPSIHFITTRPGAGGAGVAFVAEFLISFALMLVVLPVLRAEHLEKAVGWITGGLTMLYIVVEMSYSGMSLNPARSLASAVAAGEFASLWVYFLAPAAAMWLAAVLFNFFHSNPTAYQPPPDTYPMATRILSFAAAAACLREMAQPANRRITFPARR